MTRPIYEPSLTRKDAELGFGQDQLFRRPAPSRGLILPWAILRDGSTDVPGDSTVMPVQFTIASKNYDPLDEYFTWTATDLGDTGNWRFRLKLMKEGIYLIDCAVIWSATGTGDGSARLNIAPSNSYDPYGGGLETTSFQTGSDWETTGTADGDLQASQIQRVSGIFSAQANTFLDPRVDQDTGAIKGCDGVYLKAVFLEGHGDVNDWVTDFIPQSS